MLLIALSFFTVGAIIGATANDFAALLVGRSIQGIGGGGIQALTSVIITDMVPLRQRGKYIGLITLNWAAGSVSGPIIGGVLSEKVSWRWIFWLNIPFCAVAYVMIPIFLNLKDKPGNFIDKLRQIDWVGSVLFVASTTSFLIPITWGGIMYPWNHWRTLTPLIAGALGMLLFGLWSKFLARNLILRGSLFKDRTSLSNYLSIVVHGMFQWSVLYYMPLYFEAAKNLTAVQSGVALFPWTGTICPTAVVVGVLIARTGSYRWAIHSGWAMTATGVGLMILYRADTPDRVWIPLALVSGMGLGVLYPSLSLCNQAAASDADMAAAAALNPFFRNYGQMLGVAVGGSVVQNVVRQKLEQSTNAALVARASELSKNASALIETIKAMRGSADAAKEALRVELIDAYCDSLRTLWIVMCALACVALVSAVAFTKAYSLERAHETDQGFVTEEKEDCEIAMRDSR
ncbi:hypothetical protein GTA08_BOTSDO09319 [Neofusicoccum parvum]|uniref:Uncharacterized protein n=1 Tax=Neofusicoccum parvum TaxID=310453 RepID=A0ACB5RVF0_9PEZI|nr:hypothetical protein GTA08_BOTSDO09319 [Neofusicoccum parvum]GME62024.1 hypothetical protein GTA08_BOTSDO09319 [Neofusicoccum parvum]